MCDYSLQHVKSRPAAVGDTLVTHNFGTGTRGFAAAEDMGCAVCLMPGTEVAFPDGIAVTHRTFFGWPRRTVNYSTAIFRQINKRSPGTHHDALEFPDGHTVLLTNLPEARFATVLQLPAQPTTAKEAAAQERVAFVG
jgi:hypothetical protein